MESSDERKIILKPEQSARIQNHLKTESNQNYNSNNHWWHNFEKNQIVKNHLSNQKKLVLSINNQNI